ncbi:MAG: hydantoinase B/oxoprolinase family protein [Pseudomonadota bacterium]
MTRPRDKRPGWQFWIDRGGTFTDIVARRPDGTLAATKLLSEQPGRYTDAPAEGIARLLRDEPTALVDSIRIGTTVATNALLEGQAPPTALIVTEGFADLLEIGDQRRDELFALHVKKRRVPVARILTCLGRLDVAGNELSAPDPNALESAFAALVADGIGTLAVSLLHGWRHPQHERQVAAAASKAGLNAVTCSHETAPVQGYLARTETTLVDAWLTPVLARYLQRFRCALADVCNCDDITFMQSNGGLVDADAIRGKDAVLSGPAGGIVGIARCADSGERIVGFDMGGTSTDVCVWQGEFERRTDNRIGGYRLTTPMLRLETIAAGGGSVLAYRDERFVVGPDSAGADPGPAAYGKDGPATVTDANVVLGRLPVDFVPSVFGPDGDAPLSLEASRNALLELGAGSGDAVSQAESFVTVAVDNMAAAIRRETLQRGEDVRAFTLMAFGGAAGQLTCRVADALDITRVRVHAFAGVFSALGIGLADRMTLRDVAIGAPLHDAAVHIERERATVSAALKPSDLVEFDAVLQVPGADAPIAVPLDTTDAMQRAFEAAHRRRFGIEAESTPEVLALRVRHITASADAPNTVAAHVTQGAACGSAPLHVQGRTIDAAVWHSRDIGGATIEGPAIVIDAHATLVVDPGWRLTRDGDGGLRLERHLAAAVQGDVDHAAWLEVFNNRFRQVAEHMGHVLERTAHSVNIRERLDFSCALFDGQGRLIANAPHMPVHLGSMGASVRHVIDARTGELAPGDVIALNSPYAGGTHLPDITLVQAVPDTAGGTFCYLATRAHHADVGGIAPGSMPANSQHIDEEGVLIDNLRIVRGGRFNTQTLTRVLTELEHPARNVARNLADLRAQVAALSEGVRQVETMRSQFGATRVTEFMAAVHDNAAGCVRRALQGREDGCAQLELDNGLVIRVRITIDGDQAHVDFTGSSAQHAGNFNAPLAVTRAAVLYVLRTLVDHDIPLNDGCLAPVSLTVPEGSFLNPAAPAAVVAGNVETSQCVTNALYAALGVMAHAQGTMNNLTFGNDAVQYYETIAGGTGAGAGFEGADAVQSHMTNSRLTDTEVLEARLPVRVVTFHIRRGSGGGGRHRGGDGVVRELLMTEPVTVSMLSGFRARAPSGLAGGGPGLCGRNRVVRASGTTAFLPGVASVALDAGDAIRIETPGGGGYGCAQPASAQTADSSDMA